MKKILVFIILSFLFTFNALAEEDLVSLIEHQRNELTQKEEIIKEETKKLNALKTEVEENIEKYTKLLQQIEKTLKEAEEKDNKRLKHIAKAYEAMPPEDAAARLATLDNKIAIKILLKMNSKKAGLVIGMMPAEKAGQLTKGIAKLGNTNNAR
jgi:flagellar motility protein MotE (MotC chaperone)